MKKVLVFLLISWQALGATEYVSGNGYTNGFCRGDGFANFCLQQLEDRAENEAARDADIQCRLRKGNLLTYTGSCFTHCNPSYIPNGQDTMVNCNARCSYQCNIQ